MGFSIMSVIEAAVMAQAPADNPVVGHLRRGDYFDGDDVAPGLLVGFIICLRTPGDALNSMSDSSSANRSAVWAHTPATEAEQLLLARETRLAGER